MGHRLKHLRVAGFRLFDSADFNTGADLTCFHGLNGSGKTSLLEAIHYLCLGKGYFSQTDQQNIKFGGGFFRIEGEFDRHSRPERVVCTLETDKRKALIFNDVRYERLSDHLSKYPVVVIAPDDIEVVTGGSEHRRKLMDNMFCQVSQEYVRALVAYNKTLRQRNALLRRFSESGAINRALLEPYDNQLSTSGSSIFDFRTRFLEAFKPEFERIHSELAGTGEQAALAYASGVQSESIEVMLNRSVEGDVAAQRTRFGIHRDDLKFTLDGQPVSRYGSQGQSKTFLVALKLAMFGFLKGQLNTTPMLLLDDLFEKLDALRSFELIRFISGDETGQVFITETQPERLRTMLSQVDRDATGGEAKTINYIAISKDLKLLRS